MSFASLRNNVVVGLPGSRPMRLICCASMLLAGCVAPGEGNFRRAPTPAEVEQYNAMVQPEERIVCRSEVPIGSNIPVRLCRLAVDIDETSAFHREQLRRALR